MSVSSRIYAWSRVAAVAALCWGLGHAGVAAAQTPPTFALGPLKVGDCKIVVNIKNPRAGDQVGVIVDLTRLQEKTVVAGQDSLTFELLDAVRADTAIRVRVNGSDTVNPGAVPQLTGKVEGKPDGTAPEPCEEQDEDDESPFDASVFIGEAVDNFAPDLVANYKNPEDGSRQKGLFIFGFNFEYRAIGRSDSRVQLWLEGETMHGVRTGDVNCRPLDAQGNLDTNAIPPVCNSSTPFPERARYILRNATSLEAWVSPRVEFHTLQGGTDSPAKLYLALNIGFIALEKAPSVYRTSHVGFGVMADEGAFTGSYIEFGYGRNELFTPRWNRLKVAGMLSFAVDKLPIWRDNGRFFAEMTIDNDFKDGPDSVRHFFGVDIDLKKVSQ